MKSDKDWVEHKSRGPGWLRVAWICGVTLGVYVLSVGPVLRFESSDIIKIRTLQTVYRPLLAIARNSPACGQFYEWYVYRVWKVQI